MDLKSIPVRYQPAYTWLWNTEITRDGIKERIDEMYECGIRAFYIIGEPENFRPHIRRTHLSPEYLSDEYIDLVYYAAKLAEEKGMYTWLYNEGGFPSGMACGKIRETHPHLAIKMIYKRELVLPENAPYTNGDGVISAFVGDEMIKTGDSFAHEVSVKEYFSADNDAPGANIRTDIASSENTSHFIALTHEKYKAKFGEDFGSKINLMFDDESCMGTWTAGLDEIFFKKYGYKIDKYIPYIVGDKEPEKADEYRAKSDYIMLCGELVRNNYFIPMKEWLNKNGMLSTGHLDNDHLPNGNVINRYGNAMNILRAFDVPGIDVIWNQIYYPDENNGFEGMKFFPRFASSAARQQGHSTAMSESFAVYGAHVDQTLMRYAVNYQAVRGISLYNFMVISYDKKTPMLHQYRPNFVKENPSMDRLSEINGYTARLSYILENSKADVTTALYYPARSIAAGGALGKRAEESFVSLGDELEALGIDFDIIDEDLVKLAEISDSKLSCGGIYYDNIVMPEGAFEPREVVERISGIKKTTTPVIECKNKSLISRRVIFENGGEGFFIVNTGLDAAKEEITVRTDKMLYEIRLSDGEIYEINYDKKDGGALLSINLLCGEGLFILGADTEIPAKKKECEKCVSEITYVTSFISRKLLIDTEVGTVNTYFDSGEMKNGFYEWDNDFSGEVTYLAKLPALTPGEYVLDLGRLSTTARVYIDGTPIGEVTMPPYKVKFSGKNKECELKITVANTAANECTRTDYFDKMDIRDVGPYHQRMKVLEAKKERGGLFGPIQIKRII